MVTALPVFFVDVPAWQKKVMVGVFVLLTVAMRLIPLRRLTRSPTRPRQQTQGQ